LVTFKILFNKNVKEYLKCELKEIGQQTAPVRLPLPHDLTGGWVAQEDKARPVAGGQRRAVSCENCAPHLLFLLFRPEQSDRHICLAFRKCVPFLVKGAQLGRELRSGFFYQIQELICPAKCPRLSSGS
jgi:hypothetical protein